MFQGSKRASLTGKKSARQSRGGVRDETPVNTRKTRRSSAAASKLKDLKDFNRRSFSFSSLKNKSLILSIIILELHEEVP
jgi:hypothetical protein